MTAEPKPCADCVEIHGDDPTAWLNQWPQGAEWRPRYGLCLCDGCADERDEWDRAEWDEHPQAGHLEPETTTAGWRGWD